VVLKVKSSSRQIFFSDIISKSPKEYIKHLRRENERENGIPLSMFFNKNTNTIYLCTNFCVVNETGIDIRFQSGDKISKTIPCHPIDQKNKIYCLWHKDHDLFSGTFVETSLGKHGICIDNPASFKKIGFPKKLDQYTYTQIAGIFEYF
jgi:hypothetical protein